MINRKALVTTIVSVFVSTFVSILPGFAAEPGDTITSFNSVMVLNKDGSIYVDEHIDVDFGSNQHHGIIRTIPVESEIFGQTRRCHIRPISANCDGGADCNSVSYEGKNCMLKVGEANKTVSGQHRYLIKYEVSHAIRLSGDNPEIYWNVTGDQWKMPIEKARATLIVPDGIDASQLKASCFSGLQGSTQHAKLAHKSKSIEFDASNLAPGEGLTIATQFPAKSVKIPGLIEEWLFDLEQAALLVGSVIAFMVGLWPVSILLLGLFFFRGFYAENAGWDSSGSSMVDSGSSGGGFGGGGGDTW